MVEDGIITCLKRGADPKAVRLWYKLNSNTRIQVRTGAGLTEFGEVGAVVGQGMIGGALVSQAVLDDGVMDHLPPGGNIQMEFGDVPLAPLMWMDDILNSVQGIIEAREANKKVDTLMKQRGLTLNKDKSVCLVIGSKKQKQEVTRELEKQPLICGNFITKEKQQEKWLGQILSGAGLADCVSQTVAAKEGKIRGACLEIAVIVNDWRAEVVGGFDTALMLWETCCIPSLMHGAGTWMEINSQTEKQLNKLQNWFLRLIWRVGQGAPVAALLWDSQLLDMKVRVWKEKVLIILHIRSLDEDSLASRIYEKQKQEKWPGLSYETESICKQLNIEDCNTTRLSKTDYIAILNKACHSKNEEILRASASEVKCARMKEEEYGQKEYTKGQTIQESRKWFRTRFGLQDFAGNYSHDRRFAKSNWLCQCKTNREEEGHIISGKCDVYEDLRTKFGDLGEDKNLVKYFQAVLDRRDVLEDEERTRQSVTAAVVARPVSACGDGTSRPRDCILLGRSILK